MNDPIRIYDTFLFDGELDLLEHRLRENFDDTDIFVLVEAAQTYRGQSKSLLFSANRSRFAWAGEKLRAIQLASLGPPDAAPRARAEVQRNAVLLALYDASPQDVVLILDADEIPSRSLLRHLHLHGMNEPHRLRMTRHYQRLEILAPSSTCCIDRQLPFAFAAGRCRPPSWEAIEQVWSGQSGVAAPVSSFQSRNGISPYVMRFGRTAHKVLEEAGRHLTAVDPSAQLHTKLGRVFHAEWATALGTYAPHLLRCEEHAVHHRGWWYAEQVTGDLPPDLARLAHACPATRRTTPMPPMWRRRLVRTWAWVRVGRAWPAELVRFIDRNFEALLYFLFVPLIVADSTRFLLGKILHGKLSAKSESHDAHSH